MPFSVTEKDVFVESLFVIVTVAVRAPVAPGVNLIVIVVVPEGPVTVAAGAVEMTKSLECVPVTTALRVRSAPPVLEITKSRVTGVAEVVLPKSAVPPFEMLAEFTVTLMEGTAVVVVVVVVVVPVLVLVPVDELLELDEDSST